jgi:hypothetical protein
LLHRCGLRLLRLQLLALGLLLLLQALQVGGVCSR